MLTKYRRRKTKRASKKRLTRKMKGGQLVVTPTNLKNNHLCGIKESGETLGQELYTAKDIPMPVNAETLETFFAKFKKTDNNWFKFVIFNNDGSLYIYVIKGSEINKHSVIFLHGLLEVTKPTEYPELRAAYNALLEVKSREPVPESEIEEIEQVLELNRSVNMYIPCTPVVAAGSGTVNDDNSICLNTKSGHYKPTLENINVAKEIFESVTKTPATIQMKVDKELLIKKYGERVKNFSGICL